jgi:hypothetical protein
MGELKVAVRAILTKDGMWFVRTEDYQSPPHLEDGKPCVKTFRTLSVREKDIDMDKLLAVAREKGEVKLRTISSRGT